MVSVILFGLYVAALMLFHTLLPANMVGRAALGAGVALVAAITFRPLWDRIQRLVDRLFYLSSTHFSARYLTGTPFYDII